MPDDLDHEVIDSPQALFRHLYEAHGLVEALDLDPDTAPLQFWLRRHAELERAATRAAAQDRTAASTAERRSAGSSLGTPTAAPATPSPAGRGGATTSPGPANPSGTTGQGSGPRFRPFADPLVEAVAAALVGRGMDERQVRRGLSTFTVEDGRHGEQAVRAAFITPMLEAIGTHLTGDAPSRRRAPRPQPEPAPWEPSPREPASVRAEPSRREPASVRAEPTPVERETWVAQPLAARGPGPEPEADFMAIADVLQERRRSRRGGRRDASTPPSATPPTTAPPPPREPDDDVMALADALQRRPRGRPH